MRDLAEVRVDIDKVDREIVRLYAERMKLVQEVGRIKGSSGKPVKDEKREAEKLAKVSSLAEEAAVAINNAEGEKIFEPKAVGIGAAKVYRTIMDTACELEENICAAEN